jgi:hypothetical protein
MFTLRQIVAWGHHCASDLPYCGVPSAPIDTIGIQTNTCFVHEGKKQLPLIVCCLPLLHLSPNHHPPQKTKTKTTHWIKLGKWLFRALSQLSLFSLIFIPIM